jgi:hypothetical protein
MNRKKKERERGRKTEKVREGQHERCRKYKDGQKMVTANRSVKGRDSIKKMA